MISPNQSILFLNCQTLMNPLMNSPSSSAHHHLLLTHPHFHYLQLALVQVDALGEQAVCGVQDDSDHPPDPSHVPMARDDTTGRNGALDRKGKESPNFMYVLGTCALPCTHKSRSSSFVEYSTLYGSFTQMIRSASP